MKIHLHPTLRRLVLIALATTTSLSTSQADTSYVAEGVNINNITASTRFYDTGKGYFFKWVWIPSELTEFQAYYRQTGNLSFLGDLYDRIDKTATTLADKLAPLTDDSQTCWAQASMNVVEYWHSYYGVFCKDSRKLPYGYTYDKQYLEMLGGTLSLKQSLLFQDVFSNEGDNLMSYVTWFMMGDDSPSYSTIEITGQGGYWTDYFSNSWSTYNFTRVSSINDLTNRITSYLGFTQSSDGSYSLTSKGHLVYLSLHASDGVGHAITCHGFILDNNGNIKALYVSNSDDLEYSVFTLYVNSSMTLYTDPELTERWEYADRVWSINWVASIKTPEILRTMLAAYEDKSNPLVWTGNSASGKVWDLAARGTLDKLPDATTGWEVYAEDDYYPIYFDPARKVKFDNSASSRNVTVRNSGSVNELILANSPSKPYTFTGSGNTLTATTLTAVDGGASTFIGMTLKTTQTDVRNYIVRMGNDATWKGSATIGEGGTISLEGGTINLTSLTLNSGALLATTAPVTMTATTLNLAGAAELYISEGLSSTPYITFNGSIVSNGGNLDIELWSESLTDGSKYALIRFGTAHSNWESLFSTTHGTLSYANNILYLTFDPIPGHTWNGQGSIWSNNQLGNESVATDGKRVIFKGSATKTITVSGTVAPHSLLVSNTGSLTLTGGCIGGNATLTKSGAGSLALNGSNSYTGGSTLTAGVLSAGNVSAFGTGAITLKGGTLNLNGKAIPNTINVQGTATINNGSSYAGQLTLTSGSLAGSALNLTKTAQLSSGSIANVLTGSAGVRKIGTGTVTLSGVNTYSGTTTLAAGTLKAGSASAFGNSTIALTGGTLNLNSTAVSNTIAISSGSSGITGATRYAGHIKLTGGTLKVTSGYTSCANLTLGGGTLHLNLSENAATVPAINISAALNITAPTTIRLSEEFSLGTRTLATAATLNGSISGLTLYNPENLRVKYSITRSENDIQLNIASLGTNLRWKGNAVWAQGGTSGWYINSVADTHGFSRLDRAYFQNGGTATISGAVQPADIQVNGSQATTFASSTVTTGSIIGTTALTKKGSGSLTINTANSYSGGTNIHGGTVKTGTATALGTGKVNLYGGTLHLNKQAVANTITLSGSATIYGSSFKGNFSMSTGTLSADSYLGITSGKTATIKGGTIKGTITGAGSTAIAGKVYLTDGAITTNKLTIYSGNKLSVTTTKGLNGRAIQMGTGGELSSVGQVAASSLSMSGGSSLLVQGAYPRTVAISGATALTNSTAEIHGSLSGGSVSLTGSSLEQVGGPVGVKLSGKFALDNASSAAIGGSLTASNLSVKNNSALSINGDYAREVNLADTAYIASAGMNLNGYLVAKNLTLNKGRLYQHHSAKGIKITNKLTMGSGSTLSTGAALSLNSAAISGGTINMTSSTIQRINVTYTFNLTGAMDLNLGCNLTKGSTYKLITYGKTNLTSTSNLVKLLGMTGAGCKLIFNPKYIAIQVTDSTAWSKYIAANKTAFSNAYTAVTTAPTPQAVASSTTQTPRKIVVDVPFLNPLLTENTEALAQSSWGTVHASRAFVDALTNRMQNATTLGESKSTAAWLSVLGGAGRISWDGARAGSDWHLSGAAFGMQQQLSPRSALGLAIGNSRGKVSTFGAPAIDQDTTHIALYGDSTLLQREKDALTLSWSAAYGRTESDLSSRGVSYDWEQKVLQLNARATYGYALSERTTLSGFAGLEYLATDSGDIVTSATTGSVQNLRGELGVSLGHKFSDRSSMYAELSFVGDMVRHNPTAGVWRQHNSGSAPGRAGINFSLGGSHALNENWSVNASYNLELMQHTNSHSANIGFSRSF